MRLPRRASRGAATVGWRGPSASGGAATVATMPPEAGIPKWGSERWRHSCAAGRWYGLGRWYAMFPAGFVHDTVTGLTDAGDTVLDPFCGRGNAPYAAAVLGRRSVGIDVHPLAWLWTQAKLSPEPQPARLLERLAEVAAAARPADRLARSAFERAAWAPAVRGLLRSARRELDWRGSRTDRTLMAFVALHAQDKRGAGLSNQLSPSVAHSAEYSLRWWAQHGLDMPPEVDPVACLGAKIRRRYQHGTPALAPSSALLSDAAAALGEMPEASASLLVTSPPYHAVTDYWNEHWIRLWLLGNAMRKDWQLSARHFSASQLRRMLFAVFAQARRHLLSDGTVLVRCDRRHATAEACVAAVEAAWPDREMWFRRSDAASVGVSVSHGRGGSRSQEMDLLLPGCGRGGWARRHGFRSADRDLVLARR